MSYTVNRLLNRVMSELKVKNDWNMSILLELDPSTVSNVRKGRTALTHRHLLNMHHATGVPVKKLREWAGDKRTGHFTQPIPTPDGFVWGKD